MAAATSASTMSLLPISQLKQQHHGAGAVVVFRRRPRDARRRRYVVPVRGDPLSSIPPIDPLIGNSILFWGRL